MAGYSEVQPVCRHFIYIYELVEHLLAGQDELGYFHDHRIGFSNFERPFFLSHANTIQGITGVVDSRGLVWFRATNKYPLY